MGKQLNITERERDEQVYEEGLDKLRRVIDIIVGRLNEKYNKVGERGLDGCCRRRGRW